MSGTQEPGGDGGTEVSAGGPWSPHPCLEAAVQLGEVGVAAGQGQDALLRHGAVHVVVLQDHVLLEDFDGVDVLRALQLRQHHLSPRKKER